MWYVYFLLLKNGDLYVGSTNDLRRRFSSHQRGQVSSTAKHLPATLEAYVAVADEVTARALERYFKSGSGKAFAKKRFLRRVEQTRRGPLSEVMYGDSFSLVVKDHKGGHPCFVREESALGAPSAHNKLPAGPVLTLQPNG
jgi:putative endonuclease